MVKYVRKNIKIWALSISLIACFRERSWTTRSRIFKTTLHILLSIFKYPSEIQSFTISCINVVKILSIQHFPYVFGLLDWNWPVVVHISNDISLVFKLHSSSALLSYLTYCPVWCTCWYVPFTWGCSCLSKCVVRLCFRLWLNQFFVCKVIFKFQFIDFWLRVCEQFWKDV